MHKRGGMYMDAEVAKEWNRAMRFIRLRAEQGIEGHMNPELCLSDVLHTADNALYLLRQSEDELIDDIR